MRCVSIAVLTAVSFLALPAAAQVVHTPRQPAASAPVRSAAGTAVAPTRIAVVAPPQQFVFVNATQSLLFPATTSLFFSLPMFVLPDGRVFANFGNGFEQIVRPCSAFFPVVSAFQPVVQTTVVQPVVVQPVPGQPTAQPVLYTPPVPNQTTASQVMLSVAQQQTLATQSTLINSQACWATNSNGQLFVARP